MSSDGSIEVPEDARRRWKLSGGGVVEVSDLGDVLIVRPTGHAALNDLVRRAVDAAGGYEALADRASRTDADLT